MACTKITNKIIGVFVFSGFFGMRAVLDALRSSFADTGVYPKIGLRIFQIWVVIFAFVGIQLAWNLRPFVGTKDMPFALFREDTQGNFYSNTIRSLGSMVSVGGGRDEGDEGDERDKGDERARDEGSGTQ